MNNNVMDKSTAVEEQVNVIGKELKSILSVTNEKDCLDGLEYEEDCFYASFGTSNTPSFDQVDSVQDVETCDYRHWQEDYQFCSLVSSDSEQSDVDDSSNVNTKFIKVKYGDIVKKIKLRIKGFSRPSLLRIRTKNGKERLAVIGRRAEEASVAMTPDDNVNEGLVTEEGETRENLMKELAQTEEDIQTLKEVIARKVRHTQELKRKLGISVWKDITDDLSQGVKNVKESNVYQNVEEKVGQFGKAVTDTPIYQKTESVVKATAESTRSIIGGLTGGFTHKLGQIKSSESFRSFEEKVGSAYENVKTKVSMSRSNSEYSMDAEERARRTASSTAPTSPTIPEGKPIS